MVEKVFVGRHIFGFLFNDVEVGGGGSCNTEILFLRARYCRNTSSGPKMMSLS